jgi:GTP-binding protein Era
LGILNEDDYQIIFSDTPGIIKPAYKLQESMMNFVHSAFQDADVLIYIVEMGEKALKDETFFEKIKNTKIPLLLLINKIDLSKQEEVENQINNWKEQVPNAEILPISALNKFNIDKIIVRIKELLPVAPAFYDKDAITDKPKRFFVSESIREKILKHYKKEVPYSVEVEVEEFEDEKEIIRIRAIIFVMRESQKGIIIGHKGAGIKRIGTEARRDLERFFDKKIFLETVVKVKKNWRNDDRQLKSFGYE